MRVFTRRELRAAIAHALDGGQALHVHRFTAPPTAPPRFREEPLQEMAHLFDQDAERLTSTALRLGLPFVRLHRAGTAHQHVDLTGTPLERAKVLASTGAH